MATQWPEADQLFHSDPRWLGGDAAFSVDLGRDRVLWLFGDSWIAHPGSGNRRDAAFIHNSIAIEHGHNPSRDSAEFFWPVHGGAPAEMLPSEGQTWMWPGAGIRLQNSLILFAWRTQPDKSPNSLGFRGTGWNAYLIRNPDTTPSRWKLRIIAHQNDAVAMASTALRNGAYVYLFGQGGEIRGLYVARVRASRLAAGHLEWLTWWNGASWTRARARRKPIFVDADTETSVQRDPDGGYLAVYSKGFGASTIAMRWAPQLTGPWSEPRVLYRPPESDGPDPFVYAGKSHPELRGADLILTYATNSTTDTGMDDLTRYFPRFVRVTLQR